MTWKSPPWPLYNNLINDHLTCLKQFASFIVVRKTTCSQSLNFFSRSSRPAESFLAWLVRNLHCNNEWDKNRDNFSNMWISLFWYRKNQSNAIAYTLKLQHTVSLDSQTDSIWYWLILNGWPSWCLEGYLCWHRHHSSNEQPEGKLVEVQIAIRISQASCLGVTTAWCNSYTTVWIIRFLTFWCQKYKQYGTFTSA